jgi:hypothetical protein
VAVIVEAARRVLDGTGLDRIVKELNDQGVPSASGVRWSRQVLRGILLSPRLAGKRTLHGEVVADAVWEPVLTIDEHHRLVVTLRNPARLRTRAVRTYFLTGLLECAACGARMGTHPSHGRRAYWCRECGKVSLTAEPVEAYVGEWALAALDAFHGTLEGREQTDELVAENAADQEKLYDLALRWARNQITLQAWDAARQEIEVRMNMRRGTMARSDRLEALHDLVRRAPVIRWRWPSMDPDQRRHVVGTLVRRIVVKQATAGRACAERVVIEPRL